MARLRRPTIALLLAAFALALAGAPPAVAAKQVGYEALLAQVRSGPLILAIINVRGKDIEIRFANLQEWRAFYSNGAQAQLQRILHRRHIRVIFASRRHRAGARAPVRHRLRYIATGVLAATLAVAAALFAYDRRRRVALLGSSSS